MGLDMQWQVSCLEKSQESEGVLISV
jgi:hypothetical protein